jgi:hypothetical protein
MRYELDAVTLKGKRVPVSVFEAIVPIRAGEARTAPVRRL